jgi:hypothetical protein
MCDAFDINNKKVNCCRSEVLQNDFAQFSYGQLCTLELHLGYDPRRIPHVAFLLIVASFGTYKLKHQTQD